jgi:hypothetical protein
MVDKIKEAILLWIGENFGESEMNDPCYNVEMLAIAIAEALEEE